ncbi:MAG TPA: signal peptidase II [Steroidobacteraceae bacterium]|jgi:signal peptidase II|nr:signal peptidase II [Steroidobacteraceae bacterium]
MSTGDDQTQAAPATTRRWELPWAASGWRWLPLTLAVIIADQAAKSWLRHHFFLFERVRVLPVLDIILTYNTGAAFSFLADAAGWQRWMFVLLALGVSIVLLVWLRRLSGVTHGRIAAGLALIMGGALGNMIDRVRLGYVTDFVHAHWGVHYFAAFNVADSAITLGAALLLLDALLETLVSRGAQR